MTESQPLHDGSFADPFVLFHGGLYYAYGTGLNGREEAGGKGAEGNGRAFEVLTSPDLKT